MTVDPDTYIIERLGDCVLAPSQSTYFSYDEGSNDMVDTSVRESVERKQESASSTNVSTAFLMNRRSIPSRLFKS